jgi:hypothetical protein
MLLQIECKDNLSYRITVFVRLSERKVCLTGSSVVFCLRDPESKMCVMMPG